MKLHITILKFNLWYLCQKSLQIMLLPILILHKISTYMTYDIYDHITMDRWLGFHFFPTLDKQLLNYTVSLLATNQSSTVVL